MSGFSWMYSWLNCFLRLHLGHPSIRRTTRPTPVLSRLILLLVYMLFCWYVDSKSRTWYLIIKQMDSATVIRIKSVAIMLWNIVDFWKTIFMLITSFFLHLLHNRNSLSVFLYAYLSVCLSRCLSVCMALPHSHPLNYHPQTYTV